MKKALSIMLTLVMIVSMFSMMTITGSAATSYKAVKASSAPTLDGEKDSVYGSSKIEFVHQKTGEETGSYAHICWNGKDLYVFFHVVDDTEPVYKQFGAEDYVYKSFMTDCVEIAIGFDGKTSDNVGSNDKYGYNAQIRFNPYYTSTTHSESYECNQGYLGVPYSSKKMRETLGVKSGKSKAFYKKTSDGYNVEIKLNTGGMLSESPCFGLVVCDADVASENAGNNNGGHRDPYVMNKLDDYFFLENQYDLTLEGYSLASEKKDELNAIESSKAAVSASRAAASASRAASLAALSASKAALSSKSSSKTSGATSSAASDATSSGSTSTETSGTTSTESTASTQEEIGGTTVGDNTDGGNTGDADNTIGADSGNVEEGGSSLLWIIIVAGAGLLILAAAAVVLFVVIKKKNGAVAEEVETDDAQQEELDFGDEE